MLKFPFYRFLFAIALATSFLLIWSCQKDRDDLLSPDIPEHQIDGDGSITFRSEGTEEPMDKLVVLGQQINNPYSVANMTQAWNNLYSPDETQLSPTHLYVRFLPQNMEELKLLDDLDLDFDDYPLDYQILEEGDYYHDPSIPADKPTWLYTVVEPGFTFPNVQYEILEELVLAPYFSHLTAEAFRITGNEYEEESWNDPEAIDCAPTCPTYPFCLDEEEDCNDATVSHEPPCDPRSPSFPDCLEEGARAPDTVLITNDCGCRVYFDPKRPGGCIKVVDTQINPEPGVRRVKVVVKDGLFQRKVTYTDDDGCWKINKKHSKRVKIKIKFKNDKAKVRAIRKWLNVWQYGVILTHKEVKHDPPYNQWSTLFSQDANDESKKQALWYAATGNNAIFEFCDFAQADGLTLPPETLDILLTKASGGSAAAPMFDEMTANPLIFAGGLLGMEGLAALVGILNPTPVPIAQIMSVLAPYLVIWASDIVYNHGGQGLETSDDVKDTYYHEYAHASHYNAAGNNYWLGNLWYVATHGGYGDGTANGAGRTAVIEMWGYNMGPTYADRQYGLNHSNTTSTNPVTIEANRHIFLLEEFIPDPTSSNPHLWIPKGVMLDCIDNNSLNPPLVTDGVVSDNFTGYSLSQCFQSISNGPDNVETVRDILKTTFLPPGVPASSVDALFLEYGF
jgi:hypothetical protein